MDVSVCILTYYHEKYIRQTLDSVLSQITDYTFEIVISDDCSKDKTVEILSEYETKYPGIVIVNKNTENIGIPKNIFLARCLCKGRYIVQLGGDDYWINNRKIQLQAEFLDNNPEYVAVCSKVECRYDDDTTPFAILPSFNEVNKEYTVEDFEKGKNINTHGLMMRNLFLSEDGRNYFRQAQKVSEKVDDAVDNLLLLKKGKVYTIDEVTDVYRVHRKNINEHCFNSRYSDIEKIEEDILIYNKLDLIFSGEINFMRRYVNNASRIIVNIIKSDNKNEWHRVYELIPEKYRKPFLRGVFIRSIPESIKILFSSVFIKLKLLRGK